MANKKITDLTELTTVASDDYLEIVDTSVNTSKKISRENLIGGGGWVHDIVFTGAAKTAGANQAVIYNTTGRAGVSYKSGLAHGTTSMAWTWTDARSAHAVVSLRPYRPTGGAVIF